MTIDIEKIDWSLLRKQKEWLLNQDNENAAGLVHLIDSIQDQAVNTASATEIEVFGVYSDKD